jgi:hypothetical protein
MEFSFQLVSQNATGRATGSIIIDLIIIGKLDNSGLKCDYLIASKIYPSCQEFMKKSQETNIRPTC